MRYLSPKLPSLPWPSSSSSSRLLLLRVSHFSSSASSSSSSSNSYFSSRRKEDESRNVKVSVWWDFENCNVPSGINVFRIAPTITAAIRANGMKGPIEITAFGDMLQLSKSKQEALSSTGINLNHIPRGGKNSADRCLLINLMLWVSQNPPPAHLFLISGDKDFATILHRLRMSNYNILLAGPEHTHGVLSSAASIMWYWNDLLRGENLDGKYFNQPPDGPYGSWYGHYKVPLLDPFPDPEQSEESSDSDDKLHPVPRDLLKRIRQILKSHPKGLLMSELRNKLERSGFSLDKEYYGYKKFLPFLAAQEDILKVKQGNHGQFIVYGVYQKVPEAFEGNEGMYSVPDSDNENEDANAPSKLSCDERSLQRSPEKRSISPSSDQNEVDILGKAYQPSPLDGNVTKAVNATEADCSLPPRDEKIVETINPPESDGQFPPGDEKIVEMADAPESDGHPPALVEEDSTSDAGFFRRMWRQWFQSKSGDFDDKSCKDQEKYGTSASGSEKESDTALEKHFTSKDSSAKGTDEDKDSKSPVGFVDLEHSTSHSTSNEPVLDRGTSTSPAFLDRIRNWCQFWKSTSDFDKPSDLSSDKPNVIITDSGKELFSKDSFWNSMKSFVQTPEGSLLVSESKAREQMARDLQSKGPECLQSLGENDLLHLVDLLISEKKWVEECPSEVFPFKLTQVEKSLSLDHSKGLSSILAGTSTSTSESLSKHDGEGKSENVSHVESSSFTKRKLPVKSRDEVLADCQMLVNEMMREHPGGILVGLFRKHFLQKYGYHLNPQQLGFERLRSLLRTMSGVKLQGGYLSLSSITSNTASLEATVPDKQENISHTVASDIELSGESKSDDSDDSLWEELGPIVSPKFKIKPGSARKSAAKSADNQNNFDYEPAISDDEFSDPGETFPASGAEGNRKGGSEESSSLLQILDSWYSSKGRDNCKDSENVDGAVALGTNTAKLSDSFILGPKGETSLKSQGRKHRPQKTYSFVTDPDSKDNREKLVDGVLENLRKSKAMCE